MSQLSERPVHLALFSIHGLIRGENLELGRDADTGGQTLYVVELCRALAERTEVAQVDLFTRRVLDPEVDDTYRVPVEELAAGARIVRLDCGPPEYLPKEELWDHLDTFADNVLDYYREQDRRPDLVHGHYADAGYVGVRVAGRLGVPLLFTGHSLGRVKRRRLLASGLDFETIEGRYNMSRRIAAEEETLAAAQMVVVSSDNEIEEQYGLYDHYRPERMRIIPPGTDLSRFRPPDGRERDAPIFRELGRFLNEPTKPIVLALSRPDERKNLATLVEAYGGSEELQRLANLVIVAGNRDDIRELKNGPAKVLTDLLLSIDAFDLYGRVAYPKHHDSEDVAQLYRLAALQRGVFVNPALTEPFGLTLLEAAASGLPVVATEDGGPRDIVSNCRHGRLIDPLDAEAMAKAILEVIGEGSTWEEMAKNGIEGVHLHYSWSAHAESYLEELEPLLAAAPSPRRPEVVGPHHHDRALFTDLDQNLLGDRQALQTLLDALRDHRQRAAFGIATRRRLDSALKVMRHYRIPRPDVLITSVGTEIRYGPEMTPDEAWSRHIDHLWTPHAVHEVLSGLSGLELQPTSQRSRFHLCYLYDAENAPSPEEIQSQLRQKDQAVRLFVSFGAFLDITPVRASKGFALRWFGEHWNVPVERILAAGGSGADEDMMRGNTLAVVVANRHQEELSSLTDVDRIYFAEKPFAGGILEAIDHYRFFDGCSVPAPRE